MVVGRKKTAPTRGAVWRKLIIEEDLRSRDFGDRLENARTDLVWIAFRVWTAVFQVTLPLVAFDVCVRHADRGSTIGNSPREFIDRLRFVQSGQTHVIVWPVSSDVLVLVLVECVHKSEEVVLAANFAHVLGREITVHA